MSAVSDLGDHIGYWLRMVSNAISHDFAQKVAAEGVTVAEWAFLRALYDVESIAPSALADRMGMTKGAISKLADRLLEKQLVLRTDNPDDKRAHSLSLSPTGREKVPVLARIADRNDADYFSTLPTAEREALRQTLRTLADKRGLSIIPID